MLAPLDYTGHCTHDIDVCMLRRWLLISDQVADEIIVNLDDQKESLLRTRNRVNDLIFY